MKRNIFILVLILSLISACVPSPQDVRNNSEDVCIPPLFHTAFPIVPQVETNKVTPRQIPPEGNWQIQSSLPFSPERSILYIRKKRNELILTSENKMYLYSIDNDEWNSYTTDNWVGGRLFIDSNDAIWMPVLFLNNSQKQHPLLSRFNDTAGQFEFVEDASDFLQAPNVRLISNIIEDKSGTLWFFVETGNKQILTSFNIETNQVEKHYSGGIEGRGNITIGLDGSIWFSEPFKNQIVQYAPSTRETFTYSYPNPADTGKLPFNFDRANYLFTDSLGHVWTANYGWLEFKNGVPEWHRVIESPVFVTDRGLPSSQYTMSYQFSTYQSSNNWYWFTGGAGVVRLDLEIGSWCLMTTGISDVVEDKEHNLWIAVFGHFYKYPLKLE